MLTPSTVHAGAVDEVLATRQAAFDVAFKAHPERFVNGPPSATRPTFGSIAQRRRLPSKTRRTAIRPPPEKQQTRCRSRGRAQPGPLHKRVRRARKGWMARILDEVERRLGLDADAMKYSRRVLRSHGNMSSPSILFVLAQAVRSSCPQAGTFGVLAAFGPGLGIETALLAF